MFLASPKSLPFSSLEEGLSLHPTWELIVEEGAEYPLLEIASNGNNLPIQNWVNRLKRNRDAIIMPSKEALFKKLEEPGHFAMVNEHRMLEYIAETGNSDVEIVGEPFSTPASVLLTKNSHLKLFLDHCFLRLKESGAVGLIFEKHKTALMSQKKLGGTKLGQEQIGIVFVVFVVVLTLVLCLFVAELGHF